jgi:hypothetical protein
MKKRIMMKIRSVRQRFGSSKKNLREKLIPDSPVK